MAQKFKIALIVLMTLNLNLSAMNTEVYDEDEDYYSSENYSLNEDSPENKESSITNFIKKNKKILGISAATIILIALGIYNKEKIKGFFGEKFFIDGREVSEEEFNNYHANEELNKKKAEQEAKKLEEEREKKIQEGIKLVREQREAQEKAAKEKRQKELAERESAEKERLRIEQERRDKEAKEKFEKKLEEQEEKVNALKLEESQAVSNYTNLLNRETIIREELETIRYELSKATTMTDDVKEKMANRRKFIDELASVDFEIRKSDEQRKAIATSIILAEYALHQLKNNPNK